MRLNDLTSLLVKFCVVGLAIGFVGCGKDGNMSQSAQSSFSSGALTAVDDVTDGQVVYQAKCQSCHKPAQVLKKWTSAETLNSMTSGSMPKKKKLDAGEAEKIMAYLKSLDPKW